MSKKSYTINLDIDEPEPGSAAQLLARTVDLETFQDRYKLRKPLGVFNISISRLDSRLERTAKAVCSYMSTHHRLSQMSDNSEDSSISDSLEGCIYAAAEHVDDLESCLKCFFKEERDFAKSKAVRNFKFGLKEARRNVAAFANAIKHQQARIRLYEMEFIHDAESMVLIGFFIEGVEGGLVGPSRLVHGEDVRVVSVSSFLWEIFTFVHEASDLLVVALSEITGFEAAPVDRPRWAVLRKGIVEIARTPNYSLDGPHPFERVNMKLEGEKRLDLFAPTDLYGSLGNRWSTSEVHAFGGTSQLYEGDGVTKSFALSDPKQVRLLHWQDGN